MNLKMAGSSEGDILAHVQRTITEFPESSEPDNNDHDESVENQPPRGLVNLVETQGQIFTTDDGEDGPGDLKAKYLKEIAELEQEVALLEEEYMYKQTVEGLQLSWDQLELILQCVESSSNYEEAHKEKAETLKEQLERQAALTGVVFTDTTCHIKTLGPNRIEKQQKISGTCYGFSFQLEVDVLETSVSESENKACLTRLKINVDKQVANDLVEFIDNVIENKNIRRFFSGFSAFCKWRTVMKKTFHHFQQKYPEAVSLPHGSEGAYLQFQHPEAAGAVWTVRCILDVTQHGTVDPDIQLYVKSPKQLLELDEKNTLASAPEQFNKMVHTLGLEKSLDIMIQATCC